MPRSCASSAHAAPATSSVPLAVWQASAGQRLKEVPALQRRLADTYIHPRSTAPTGEEVGGGGWGVERRRKGGTGGGEGRGVARRAGREGGRPPPVQLVEQRTEPILVLVVDGDRSGRCRHEAP